MFFFISSIYAGIYLADVFLDDSQIEDLSMTSSFSLVIASGYCAEDVNIKHVQWINSGRDYEKFFKEGDCYDIVDVYYVHIIEIMTKKISVFYDGLNPNLIKSIVLKLNYENSNSCYVYYNIKITKKYV